MKDRHRLVIKWLAEHAGAIEAFSSGKGPVVWGFNNQDYRQLRILSSIFFAVERHGVLPGSFGYPQFHFEYKGTMLEGRIGPIERYSRRPAAKLRFAVASGDPGSSASEWLDGDTLLEARVPEIADAIVAATRAFARARREQKKASLEAELFRLLDRMKALEELDGVAARSDPRTFQTLLAMAEQHRMATLVRRFLRSVSHTISDGALVVAGHALDDWVTWAAAKTDELDPLVQGAEYVFKKLVKS